MASTAEITSEMHQMRREFQDLKLSITSTVSETVAAALTIQAGPCAPPSSTPQRDLYIPHASLLTDLRDFLGDPSAVFKTPEQAEALEVVKAGGRHLLLIGPTAMGKSLVYQLPAAQRDYGTTCVLLPLSPLRQETERKCQALGITCSQWEPDLDEKPKTKIVYVSPEDAQTAKFTDYIVEMYNLGLLVQFVIDEVHLVKTHSNFRYCFSNLLPLIKSSKFQLSN